jgi:hypothetical protein
MPRQTKPQRARRCAPQQIDLFAEGPQPTTDGVPAWSALPTDIRAVLTKLIVRLILEHADKQRIGSMPEAGHDL